MGFINREKSDFDGKPMEMYRFVMGEQIWLFTSSDHEIDVVDDTYKPTFISRGKIVRTGDIRKSSLDITVAADNPVALLYRNPWLIKNMLVTIFRRHYEDSESSVIWLGRIVTCKWSDGKAVLASDSIFTLYGRAGLRRVFQVGCPHILYKTGRGECNVDKDAFLFEGVTSGVDGNILTVSGASAHPDGYFTGGSCKAGDNEMMIAGHSGSTITLLDALEGLVSGQNVQLWPGCDRTTFTCINTFNNIPNYGGMPDLPYKNPFSGDAIV